MDGLIDSIKNNIKVEVIYAMVGGLLLLGFLMFGFGNQSVETKPMKEKKKIDPNTKYTR